MSYVSSVSSVGLPDPSHTFLHTITSDEKIEAYYAAILRNNNVIWSTTKALKGSGEHQFDLNWDLSFVVPGDTYIIIGFVQKNGEPVEKCGCLGKAVDLSRTSQLLLIKTE